LIDLDRSILCLKKAKMSTLDEITKEKQRIGEALARVDAQRDNLTGQLSELEAAERVLARYSKGTPARKTASAKTPTTATKAAASPLPRRPRTRAEGPAGGKRTSSSLSDQVLALANGKTQQEIAAACKGRRGDRSWRGTDAGTDLSRSLPHRRPQ
jgi:cell wall-associated NlpC family hydrolase